MKKTIIFITICIIAVSCVKENGIWSSSQGSSIKIGVPDINSPKTKSGSTGEQLFDSFAAECSDGQELWIEAYVNDFPPEDCRVETKGAITYIDKFTNFWMNAYAHADWTDDETGTSHSAGQCFDGIKTVTKSGDIWSIADDPRWINGVDMTFWSWAGESSSSNTSTPSAGLTPGSIDLENNKASISYTTNGNLDLIYAFNKEKRIFDTKTREITDGTGTYKTGYKESMDIRFYHALSAVRFDISNLRKNGFEIKKITFKGVVNQASCEITANPTEAGTTIASINPLDFTWTPKDVTPNTADLSIQFKSSDFTETGVDKETEKALMSLESDKLFFLIPQQVKDMGITVELVYKDESGAEVTATAVLNHDIPWEAGKYYTYKLSPEKRRIEIEVTDTVTKTLKKDVSIKNTGNVAEFVRAAIVAYWTDAFGNYVAPCDFKSQGTLAGFYDGDVWTEGADGFFYYGNKVEPGQDVGPSLMTSYAPASAPMTGATLRMVITAQAIQYDDTKTCYVAFNN